MCAQKMNFLASFGWTVDYLAVAYLRNIKNVPECHFLHQPANLVGRKFQISQEILFVIEKNFNCYPFPQRKIAHHALTAYNLRPCKLIIDYSKLFDSFEASVIILNNVALHRNQNTERRGSVSCPFVNRFLSSKARRNCHRMNFDPWSDSLYNTSSLKAYHLVTYGCLLSLLRPVRDIHHLIDTPDFTTFE